MVLYPGIGACRDQLPGEKFPKIDVEIINVPTITPRPTTPVPIVTVDPTGNDTRTVSMAHLAMSRDSGGTRG